MRCRELLAALAACFILTPITNTAQADDPAPRKEPKVEFVRHWYPDKEGSVVVVTEITKDSITLKCNDEKPRKFPVCEALAAGKISEPRPFKGFVTYKNFPPDMYRLTDVKVGDWVAIFYSRVDGVDICDHIRIEKRPCGLVPPLPDGVEFLPGTKEYPRTRYHEFQNAYWDFEDRGIPFPKKFGIVRYHKAPMPREVKQPAAPKGT